MITNTAWKQVLDWMTSFQSPDWNCHIFHTSTCTMSKIISQSNKIGVFVINQHFGLDHSTAFVCGSSYKTFSPRKSIASFLVHFNFPWSCSFEWGAYCDIPSKSHFLKLVKEEITREEVGRQGVKIFFNGRSCNGQRLAGDYLKTVGTSFHKLT